MPDTNLSADATMIHLKFSDIDQNPYRNLIDNPLTDEQVDKLAKSMDLTGLWDGGTVRPHPTKDGRYQLVFGHARIEAAKRTGLTSGNFVLSAVPEDQMIRRMATENVAQFGKRSFSVYKEAVVAAAIFIMTEVLAGRGDALRLDYAPGYAAADYNAAQLKQTIIDGGCPGYRIIGRFFNDTINRNDILLALAAFRDTGELAEWHKANNPQLSKRAKPPKPTLDAEALRQFDKVDHVRTFVQAVQDTNTPVAEQQAVVKQVVEKLATAPPRSRSAREKFETNKESDEQFNAKNIRHEVVMAAVDRQRSPKRKAEMQRIEQMSSLERALEDFVAGLSRTVHGYRRIKQMVNVMGGVTETDMTGHAESLAKKAHKLMAELQNFAADPHTFRKMLRIKAE
jgi:hypothetical protein